VGGSITDLVRLSALDCNRNKHLAIEPDKSFFYATFSFLINEWDYTLPFYKYHHHHLGSNLLRKGERETFFRLDTEALGSQLL
jgi:hypothetical protein